MRTLAVTQNMSVDGVIEMVTDWFDPADESRDQDDVAAATREQASRSDAVHFGRKTFGSMRGFWPLQQDDTTGVTDHLNKTRSTSSPPPSATPNGRTARSSAAPSPTRCPR